MQDRFKFKGYWYNDVQKEWWVFDNPEFITGDGTAEIWSNSEGGAYPELPSDADLHLCQCTGLKDKNGKLIYEGDIIKIPDDYATYGQFACEKREVYWNEGFRLKPKWDAKARGNWLEDTKDFEIIGNRYQNPELLED